jgi:hypothetical protein
VSSNEGKGGHGRCSSAAAPAPRDYGAFDNEPLPRPPSFNEADRSDKTAFPAPTDMTRREIRTDRDRFRCRIESLQAMEHALDGKDIP